MGIKKSVPLPHCSTSPPSSLSPYTSPPPRAAGDAYVELETADDLEDALRMHRRDMGSRYTVHWRVSE